MTKGNDMQGLGAFSDVLADDRVLDAIGRGERIDDASSPLYALLSSAREEAEANIPAPPNLGELLGAEYAPEEENVASIGRHRKKSNMRCNARAAAAGGLSVTSMFVAGGVAAALAIGGLGYAAYNGTLPTQKTPQTVQAEAESTAPATSSQGTISSQSPSSVRPPVNPAPREEAPAPEPEVAEPSSVEPAAPTTTENPAPATTQQQPVPLPDGQVLADGQAPVPGAEGAGEGAVPMMGGEMGAMRAPFPGDSTATTTEDEDEQSETSTTSRRPAPGEPLGPLTGNAPRNPMGATDTTR